MLVTVQRGKNYELMSISLHNSTNTFSTLLLFLALQVISGLTCIFFTNNSNSPGPNKSVLLATITERYTLLISALQKQFLPVNIFVSNRSCYIKQIDNTMCA
jgi:uncharacterized membrane protein